MMVVKSLEHIFTLFSYIMLHVRLLALYYDHVLSCIIILLLV